MKKITLVLDLFIEDSIDPKIIRSQLVSMLVDAKYGSKSDIKDFILNPETKIKENIDLNTETIRVDLNDYITRNQY